MLCVKYKVLYTSHILLKMNGEGTHFCASTEWWMDIKVGLEYVSVDVCGTVSEFNVARTFQAYFVNAHDG